MGKYEGPTGCSQEKRERKGSVSGIFFSVMNQKKGSNQMGFIFIAFLGLDVPC